MLGTRRNCSVGRSGAAGRHTRGGGAPQNPDVGRPCGGAVRDGGRARRLAGSRPGQARMAGCAGLDAPIPPRSRSPARRWRAPFQIRPLGIGRAVDPWPWRVSRILLRAPAGVRGDVVGRGPAARWSHTCPGGAATGPRGADDADARVGRRAPGHDWAPPPYPCRPPWRCGLLQTNRPAMRLHPVDIRTFLPSPRTPLGVPVQRPAARSVTRSVVPALPQPVPPQAAAQPAPILNGRPAAPTPPQVALLTALAGQETSRVDALGHACGNMHQVLARCVARGWAVTWKDTPSGSQFARLSPSGEAVLAQVASRRQTHLALRSADAPSGNVDVPSGAAAAT